MPIPVNAVLPQGALANQQPQPAPAQLPPPTNLPAPTPGQLPPPISSVAAGELPAIRFPAEPKTRSLSPLSAFVAQNLDSIVKAGVDFTQLPDKQSVLFNPVKTTKEAIHKAYKEGTLDKLAPEIPALRPETPRKAAGTRTVHAAPPAPVAAPALPVQNAAGAPGPNPDAPAAPDGGGPSGTVTPSAPPVKVDKKLLGARTSALKNESVDGSKLPATVVDKLSKRAI